MSLYITRRQKAVASVYSQSEDSYTWTAVGLFFAFAAMLIEVTDLCLVVFGIVLLLTLTSPYL